MGWDMDVAEKRSEQIAAIMKMFKGNRKCYKKE